MGRPWQALRALRLRLFGPAKELVGTDQFGNKYYRVPKHETRAADGSTLILFPPPSVATEKEIPLKEIKAEGRRKPKHVGTKLSPKGPLGRMHGSWHD